MIEVTIRAATDKDAAYVASRMRQSDIDEAKAISGKTPHQTVSVSRARCAEVWCACVDGRPAALFGCAALSVLGRHGSPWLLGTDDLDRVPRQMVEITRGFVGVWRELYDLLENVADGTNKKSLRWLSRVGFTLDAPVRLPNGALVVRFSTRKQH